jgi:polysaccharide pyruvyl transferase WcaK-like protein
MHVLVKGYYGFKNLGDELILFSLLNWIEETLHPQQISLISGDPQWLEHRLITHKEFFPPLLHKLTLLPRPNWKKHLHTMLGFERGKYDFLVFGGGQVIDEERKFPHNGRNLPLLYRRTIKRGNFALIGGIGTQNKDGTAALQKILLEHAKIIILRDSFSE